MFFSKESAPPKDAQVQWLGQACVRATLQGLSRVPTWLTVETDHMGESSRTLPIGTLSQLRKDSGERQYEQARARQNLAIGAV